MVARAAPVALGSVAVGRPRRSSHCNDREMEGAPALNTTSRETPCKLRHGTACCMILARGVSEEARAVREEEELLLRAGSSHCSGTLVLTGTLSKGMERMRHRWTQHTVCCTLPAAEQVVAGVLAQCKHAQGNTLGSRTTTVAARSCCRLSCGNQHKWCHNMDGCTRQAAAVQAVAHAVVEAKTGLPTTRRKARTQKTVGAAYDRLTDTA